MEKLEIKAAIQIQKPVSIVFDAIVDPGQMSNYFIAEGSARMESGATVNWKFPEFDDVVPVRIHEVVTDNEISFYWDNGNRENKVTISLSPRENNSTLVNISEKEMDNDDAGIKWLVGNTEGWANFLACLKAWLEYGINLRKGAFDFMRK